MTNIIILVVILVVAFIFLSRDFGGKKDHKKYLFALARFLGYTVKPEQGQYPESIPFEYKGHHFSYEHIEEVSLDGQVLHRAILKSETEDSLTLSFTERSSGTILRTNVDTLSDMMQNPWGLEAAGSRVPAGFEEFVLFTNQQDKAADVLADDKCLKIFAKWKNKDTVGHPVMPLEILEGNIVLHLSPPGGRSPCVQDLQIQPGVIQEYAEILIPLVDKLKEFKVKYKYR